MNRLKNILVGVDFSNCSKAALAQAARLAKWNNARLHVIHVLESLVVSELAGSLKVSDIELREITVGRAREKLRAWVKELGLTTEPAIDVGIGSPLDVMLSKIRSVSADVLVLGEVGSSLPGRGAGILASKCLRKAPCKVMLVNEAHIEAFRVVQACIDFSETSRVVAAQGLHVAAADGSQIHFLHVFDPPWRRLGYLRPIPEATPDFQKQYRDTLRYRLERFVGDTGGLNVRYDLHEASSTGCGIADYARLLQADLIVLGTRGQTNLKYVLLGSTAERLLRDVPCSILAIKPPGQPNPITSDANAASQREESSSTQVHQA
jgi:universal stress protein E